MSTNTVFPEHISRLKRRFLLKALNRFFLSFLMFLSGILSVFKGMEMTGALEIETLGPVTFFSIGLSLVLSLTLLVFTRKSFTHKLIEIDRRLNLFDRISTAYEYRKYAKPSQLVGLLIKDAGHRLDALSSSQLIPRRVSVVHLLFIFFFTAYAALFFVDLYYPASRHVNPVSTPVSDLDQNKLETIRTLMETYTSKKISTQKKVGGKTDPDLFQEIDRLSKNIADRSITSNKLLSSVDGALKRIAFEQARIAKSLGSKIKIETVHDMALQETIHLEKLTPETFTKLDRMLSRMFDHMVPESIRRDFDRLNTLSSLDRLLEQIRDEVEPDERGGRISRLTDGYDPNQDRHGPAGSSDRTKGSKRPGESSDFGPGENSAAHGTGTDSDNENGSEEEDGSGDGSSSTAGRSKAGGETNTPGAIDSSRGTALQDKTTPASGEIYGVPVRALTGVGKAKVSRMDIARSYRQEIESILTKEAIPVAYRDYIKNYFISIGLAAKPEQR